MKNIFGVELDSVDKIFDINDKDAFENYTEAVEFDIIEKDMVLKLKFDPTIDIVGIISKLNNRSGITVSIKSNVIEHVFEHGSLVNLSCDFNRTVLDNIYYTFFFEFDNVKLKYIHEG